MNESITRIRITRDDWNRIAHHCKRKLNGFYFNNETEEKQAYGIVGGSINGVTAEIKQIFELKQNYRINSNMTSHMNNLMNKLAVPSGLAIEKRGWVVSPVELANTITNLENMNCDMIGTYHMHHENSWYGDPVKCLPTELDKELCKNTDMIMFIVHINSGEKATIRAFYEAVTEIIVEVI